VQPRIGRGGLKEEGDRPAKTAKKGVVDKKIKGRALKGRRQITGFIPWEERERKMSGPEKKKIDRSICRMVANPKESEKGRTCQLGATNTGSLRRTMQEAPERECDWTQSWTGEMGGV